MLDTQKTKHRKVVEYVLDQILNGKFKAGDRLPSDTQLVRRFQISRPTAAKAMRQLEKEGYIERRVGSGSYVRVPALAKPSLIGLIAPEIGDAELFEPLCSEIAQQCQKHGLSLLWADSTMHNHGDDHHEQAANELCQRYISQGVSGVFFAPVEFSKRMMYINRNIAERLDNAGISVVLLDRDLERLPNRSRFDLVGIDNFRAGYMQAEYLVQLGCKKIAYVSRFASAPTIDLRIAGMQHALRHHGLDSNQNNVFTGDVQQSAFLRHFNPRKFDSIICSNDTTASMLLTTLTTAGIQVPQDIRMIGIDDVKIARQCPVPLTTVQQPFREIGNAAVDAMTSRIENRSMMARDIYLDVKMVVRNSCGVNHR